jgi:hypothetical protein
MPSQPNRLLIPSFPSSTPRPLPLGGRATPKALRPREWAGLSNDEILSRFVPGKASPHTVLEVLLKLHNMEHTARAKSVSFKTRYERANFLRHFFRELERPRRLQEGTRPAQPGPAPHPGRGRSVAQGRAEAVHHPDLPQLPARPGQLAQQTGLHPPAGVLRA